MLPMDIGVQLFLPIINAILLYVHHVLGTVQGTLHTLFYLFLTTTGNPDISFINAFSCQEQESRLPTA